MAATFPAEAQQSRLIELFPLLHRALRLWRGEQVVWKHVRSHNGNQEDNAAQVFAKFAAKRLARRLARRAAAVVVVDWAFGS